MRFQRFLLALGATIPLLASPAHAVFTYSDNFNSGSTHSGLWESISNGIVRGAGEPGFNGSHALWFDGNGARHATTQSFNTSFGGRLEFRFRVGNTYIGGGPRPLWEQSDPYEYIAIEYSHHGGPWRTLRYYQGWNAAAYGSWQPVSIELPPVALSASAQYRFRQTSHSGATWDHWAIDDVTLEAEVPAGTSWSQAMPEQVTQQFVRVAPGDGVQMLMTASGNFTLGAFNGVAGTYLASAGADGSWSGLTALDTTGATIRDMAVDGSGNVYLCGSYKWNPLGLAYSSNNAGSGFVVKFNSAHQFQWGATGWNATIYPASFESVSVDGSGQVTVAGAYHMFMRFGPNGYIGEPELGSSTPSNPSGEISCTVLARFNASGAYQWAKRIGDGEYTDPVMLHGLHQDGSGNLYLHGYYNSQASLGHTLTVSPLSPLSGPASGSQQMGFVLKCDGSGNALWATHLGQCSDVRDVDDGSGVLYVTGNYGKGAVEFSPQGSPVPPNGDPDSSADDLFLVGVDPANGNVSWVKTAGPSLSGSFGDECLRTDGSGNAYWLYECSGDHTLSGGAVTAGPFNRILSRWASDGSQTWVKRALMGTVAAIDTDSIGQTYAAGLTGDLAVFESNATVEPSFLHKFNNIFEATKPAAVDITRGTIPSNWGGGSDLGELLVADADGSGTYTLELANGDGDDHNAWFTIHGSGHLLLAAGVRLARDESLTCRVRVTDQGGDASESVLGFTVVEPVLDQWAVPFTVSGGGGIDVMRAAADGGVVAAGYFIGTITAGSFSDTAAGSADWFIVKYDGDGVAEWLLTGGSTGFDRCWALDCGSDGRIHAGMQVSYSTDPYTIKHNGNNQHQSTGNVLANGGGRDLCMMSIKPDGLLRWVSRMGGSRDDTPGGIDYDPTSGRCAFTGSFYGNFHTEHYLTRDITLGQGPGGLISGSAVLANGGDSCCNREIYVLSYDSYGNREWMVRAGSNLTNYSYDQGKDVAFDGSGNLLVTGSFSGYSQFGTTTKAGGQASGPYPNADAFLWKLNATGAHQWVKTGGTSSYHDYGLRVGVDGSGVIHMAAQVYESGGGTASFSPYSFQPANQDIVVVRYNSGGTALGYHHFTDNGTQTLAGFRVYPSGELMVGTSCSIINGGSLGSTGHQHYFDATGTRQWSGTAYASTVGGFTSDLVPCIGGNAWVNQEVVGVVLPGGPYVAQISGPTPAREAPTGITLSAPVAPEAPLEAMAVAAEGEVVVASVNLVVDENQPAGTVVATIDAIDPDSNDFVFQLIGGIGSDGNPAFVISGNELLTTGSLNYEEIPSYSVRLRAVDELGLAYEQSFTIDVGDLPDTITPVFTISDQDQVWDGQPHGVTVSVDPYGLPFTVTYDGAASEPSAAGAYAVVVSPDHPEYAGDGNDTLWIRDGFMQWIAGKIDSGVANDPDQQETGWGKDADYEGDGVANGLEYYHGADPAVQDRAATAIVAGSPVVGGYTFEWVRLKNGPDANLKWSPDMVGWHDSGSGPGGMAGTIGLQVIEDLGANERVEATLQVTGSERAFLRVEVP